MDRPPLRLDELDPAAFAAIGVSAPAPFFMSGEDSLELGILCGATGETLTCAGRFMTIDRQIRTFEMRVVPSAARVMTTVVESLGQGWLLNFTAWPTSGNPNYGEMWARVRVLRGRSGATSIIGTLAYGYVTLQQGISFPGTTFRNPLEGPGRIRSITGTDPAAGAEISETVPTGARWMLRAIAASFVTDATVANRFPVLKIDDGATVFYIADPPAAQAASNTLIYVSGSGVTRLTSVAGQPSWALPVGLILMAGSRIRTQTVGIVAGDNYGAPQLLVEEWLEGL